MNEQAPTLEVTMTEADHMSPDGYKRREMDEDKAHTLALVGNELESSSAELRKEMVEGLGATAYRGGYNTEEVRKSEAAVKTIDDNNRTVDTIYAQHSQAYDKLHATKR